MITSAEPAHVIRNPVTSPDGRQTRIEFFNTSKHRKISPHVVLPKKSSFEWWHAIAGWLKPSAHEQEDQLEAFRKFLEEKSYSSKTCYSYLFMIRKFLTYLDEKGVTRISFGDIEDYNYEFFVSGSYSRSYQLQFINGLTRYLEFTEGVKANLKGLRRTKAGR
ncbi:MAG: phage integrase N-terminal SAM-like domain-containing protein [Bacteroidales bacterium]